MKLIIRRGQAEKTGFLGGHKGVSFKLYSRIEIDDNEKLMISKYQVGEEVLVGFKQQVSPTARPTEVLIKVNDLLQGKEIELANIEVLLGVEKNLKEGCQKLKHILSVMKSFGGEEVIEI